MKLGLYVACNNNPVFLRTTLLQLEAQTLLPNLVAIHENGHADMAISLCMCHEVVLRLQNKGVEFIHDHSPDNLGRPFNHYLPLKRLVDRGCNYYTKWDHDDIFYENHLRDLVDSVKAEVRTGFDQVLRKVYFPLDWRGKQNADVLILNPKAYVYKPAVDFGLFNPLGGMSDCFIFSHNVAEQYLKDMVARAGRNEADDYILHKYTLPQFTYGSVQRDRQATACYVSHGRNDSTSHWVRQTPAELTGAERSGCLYNNCGACLDCLRVERSR